MKSQNANQKLLNIDNILEKYNPESFKRFNLFQEIKLEHMGHLFDNESSAVYKTSGIALS